jgi:5-enolpyruvylshikimate-3-phosphate synthase
MVGTAVAQRTITLRTVERCRLSETDRVGTVALGRAQFGAQYRFAIIQTLLQFQNTK